MIYTQLEENESSVINLFNLAVARYLFSRWYITISAKDVSNWIFPGNFVNKVSKVSSSVNNESISLVKTTEDLSLIFPAKNGPHKP